MQVRLCDRCRVEVPETAPAANVRGVTLPADLPSTAPTKGPIEVTLALTVQAPADLCPSCRRSAVLESVAQELAADASTDDKRVLGARLIKVLRGG